MNNKQTIQGYINNFRRHLSSFLRPNIGLTCNVYPAESDGAILEFTIGPGVTNEDVFKPVEPTVNDGLAKIEQRAFGGHLSGFRFGGTNVVMEGNRIILIKGEESPSEWSDSAANADVKKILPPATGGGK
jgi:hypothetical protein